MLKFNKVLLASDFDNTLVYTQGALERGEDIPPMSARNREAVEYFIQNGGYFSTPPAARCPPLPATPRICPATPPASSPTARPSMTSTRAAMWRPRF